MSSLKRRDSGPVNTNDREEKNMGLDLPYPRGNSTT